MVNYCEYELCRRERIKVLGFTAFLLLSTGILFYNSPVSLLILPLIYRPICRRYSKKRTVERKKMLRNQFRDLLFSFATSFSLGLHMKEAMCEGQRQLDRVYGEKTLLSDELSLMVKRMDAAGERDTDLWDDFAKRSSLEDIQSFAAVFSCCKETGGDLPSAVKRAADMIADKISIENEIRKIRDRRRTEAGIIGVMPVVVLVFLRIFASEYVQVMYSGAGGRIVMSLCIGLTVIAMIIGERITSIEI